MKLENIIIVVVFALSCIALILSVTSIATSEWIISTATLETAAKPSIINYGLFSGYLENYMISIPFKYDLTVTCNYAEGLCIYSCHENIEERQNELIKILKHEKLEPCPSKTTPSFSNFQLQNYKFKSNDTSINKNYLKSNDENIYFIGSGYWVCTVMFLIIEIIFSTAACIFTIINYYWNPIEPILNIFGLYIWNGIAAISGLLTMIIWGALFDTTLKYNIVITDTLRSELLYNSNGLASLGFSYFILLGGIIFNLINIGLLIFRNILLSKIPPPVIIDKGNNDTMLTFY